MRRWRRPLHMGFGCGGENDADRLFCKKLYWELHAGLEKLCRRPEDCARNLNLLERIGTHKNATITLSKEKLHHVAVEFQLLEPFLRAEVWHPHSTTPHIAELGLDHST